MVAQNAKEVSMNCNYILQMACNGNFNPYFGPPGLQFSKIFGTSWSILSPNIINVNDYTDLN